MLPYDCGSGCMKETLIRVQELRSRPTCGAMRQLTMDDEDLGTSSGDAWDVEEVDMVLGKGHHGLIASGIFETGGLNVVPRQC